MDKKMDMLCNKLKDELASFSDKQLNASNVEMIHKISQSVDSICKIKKASEEEEYSEAYSRRGGMWDARGSYDSGNSYNYPRDDGYSGMHYVRGHYSRAEGTERMTHQLQEMMEDAQTEKEREAIRKALEMLR